MQHPLLSHGGYCSFSHDHRPFNHDHRAAPHRLARRACVTAFPTSLAASSSSPVSFSRSLTLSQQSPPLLPVRAACDRLSTPSRRLSRRCPAPSRHLPCPAAPPPCLAGSPSSLPRRRYGGVLQLCFFGLIWFISRLNFSTCICFTPACRLRPAARRRLSLSLFLSQIGTAMTTAPSADALFPPHLRHHSPSLNFSLPILAPRLPHRHAAAPSSPTYLHYCVAGERLPPHLSVAPEPSLSPCQPLLCCHHPTSFSLAACSWRYRRIPRSCYAAIKISDY